MLIISLVVVIEDKTKHGAGGSGEDWSTVGGAGGGTLKTKLMRALKTLWMELVGVLKMKPKALYPVCKLIASFLKLYDNVMIMEFRT